jgi:hypothetical protein
LAAILGEKASGLSATNIVSLKVGWAADYKAWSQRDLRQKRYVYWWADGVYWSPKSLSASNLSMAKNKARMRLLPIHNF